MSLIKDFNFSVLKLETGMTASSPNNSRDASINASLSPASVSISGHDTLCLPKKRDQSKP